jgi:histidine triad (HIT) family protein
MVKKEIMPQVIWEDENHFAFLDVNPWKQGHTVLVPKKHTDYIFDIESVEYQNLFLAAKEVATILKSKLQPKRIGVMVLGFGVPHAHIHLIPLDSEKDMNYTNAKPAMKEDLEKIAKLILEK